MVIYILNRSGSSGNSCNCPPPSPPEFPGPLTPLPARAADAFSVLFHPPTRATFLAGETNPKRCLFSHRLLIPHPHPSGISNPFCRRGTDIYILLTKREGRTGRISARGLDSTDRGPIFSQYGPEQAWLIRDLLHDWKQSFKIFCFVKKKKKNNNNNNNNNKRAKRKAKNDPILTESL